MRVRWRSACTSVALAVAACADSPIAPPGHQPLPDQTSARVIFRIAGAYTGAPADSALLAYADLLVQRGQSDEAGSVLSRTSANWMPPTGMNRSGEEDSLESSAPAVIIAALTTVSQSGAYAMVEAQTVYKGDQASHDINISAVDQLGQYADIPPANVHQEGLGDYFGNYKYRFHTVAPIGSLPRDCGIAVNAATTHSAWRQNRFIPVTWGAADPIVRYGWGTPTPCPSSPPPGGGGDPGGPIGGGFYIVTTTCSGYDYFVGGSYVYSVVTYCSTEVQWSGYNMT